MADVFQTYVNNAYGPWLYEKLNESGSNHKSGIRSVANVLCSLIGLFFICLALFSQDYIVLFVDEAFVESWKYIPAIISVFTIKIIYYFYVNILFYYKKASRLLFVATLSSSFLNIILSLLLIPLLNVYGSILADGISMLVRVTIIVIISKRFGDIGLKVSDFLLHMILITSFIFVGLSPSYFVYNDTFSIFNLLFKFFIVLVYISIAIIFHKKHLASYLSQIKQKLIRK